MVEVIKELKWLKKFKCNTFNKLNKPTNFKYVYLFKLILLKVA